MKPSHALLLIGCCLTSFSADRLDVNKASPEAAAMNPARLADIAIRMKAYVDANQAVGIVAIVGRQDWWPASTRSAIRI